MKFKKIIFPILLVSLLTVNNSIAMPKKTKDVLVGDFLTSVCDGDLRQFCVSLVVGNQELYDFLFQNNAVIEHSFKEAFFGVIRANQIDFDNYLDFCVSGDNANLILTHLSCLCAQACVDSLIEQFSTSPEEAQPSFFEENKEALIKSFQEAIKEGLEDFKELNQQPLSKKIQKTMQDNWIPLTTSGLSLLVTRNPYWVLGSGLTFKLYMLNAERKRVKKFALEGTKDFNKKLKLKKLEEKEVAKSREKRIRSIARGVRKKRHSIG